MKPTDVTIIIPTQNGFVLMPWNMNCLVSMNDADHENKGILVATDVEGLLSNVHLVYDHSPQPSDFEKDGK